jgi:hypothetical protein
LRVWHGLVIWWLLMYAVGLASAADEVSQIKDLERQTWEVYVKRDLAGLEKITAPDFIFSDGESTQNWEQTKAGFATELITSYKLGGMNVLRVSPDEVILSYQAELVGTQDGKDISGRLAVASAWAKRKGKWLSVFVHEVPLPKKTVAANEGSMQLKVDHAGICSYELGPLQQAFAEIGMKTEYGGAHATGGTHNALLGFDDGSYIELIALQHPEDAAGEDAKQWTALKPDAARACFWAVDVPNISASVSAVRAAGLEIADPKPGSRKKPDGTLLSWQTAAVNEGEGGILPFFIEDKTPRSSRIQPSSSVKGSDLSGIALVVLGVKDLDRGIATYRRAYSLPAPELATDRVFGAKMALFQGTPVLLVSPLGTDSWMVAHLEQFGEGPLALLLGTTDFVSANQRLKLSGGGEWFGRKVAWFDTAKLHGARLGVVE